MRKWVWVAVVLAGCVGPVPVDGPVEDVVVRDMLISDESFEWEPSAAVDPTDPLHYVVAYRHSSGDTITVRTTTDGGKTWAKSELPTSASSGPAAQWDHNGDPVVFFSPEGELYIGGIAGKRTEPPPGSDSIRHGRSIFIVKSPDGGRTFSEPILIAQGGGTITRSGNVETWDDFQNLDRPWFAAGADGVVLAVWNDIGHDGARVVVDGQSTTAYDGHEFKVSISRDGGSTWSPEKVLIHGGWPGALVRSDGTFVVAHSSFLDYRLHLFTSVDGATWKEQALGIGQDQPDLQEYEGDIIVGTTGVLDGKKLPAYYRVGAKATGPYMFAQGQELNPFTNIATDPAGGFWASWYGQNGSMNLARFLPESAPWPTERRVVAAVEPDLGAYGDYVDTLAVSDRLYVAWNDRVDGDNGLRVSVYH